uniref:C-type lectin domain-containing protein n=1 Tax=Sinocyclocheilus anshuiensis TaxID=1608454 RepID=A0A671L6G0_9TELE
MDIYANADPVNSLDVRTETENSYTKRHQTPQHAVELVVFTDGWVCYQSSLYFISFEIKNWEESRTYCRNKGADLIIINNSEEQVSDFMLTLNYDSFWIGLNDRDVEDTWKWVDGSKMTSMFWRSSEPNGHTKENCALAYASGWIDHGCHKEFKWICEKNI